MSYTESQIAIKAPGARDRDEVSLADRIAHSDQFRAISKRPLHLDLIDHFRHPFHDIVAPQNGGAILHQVGARAAVTHAFEEFCTDEGYR